MLPEWARSLLDAVLHYYAQQTTFAKVAFASGATVVLLAGGFMLMGVVRRFREARYAGIPVLHGIPRRLLRACKTGILRLRPSPSGDTYHAAHRAKE